MKRLRDITEDLKVAVTATDHIAYAAAARVGWPDALLDLREALYEMDVVNTFLLRRTREVQLADVLLRAVESYLRSSDGNRGELDRALAEYRELRGPILAEDQG